MQISMRLMGVFSILVLGLFACAKPRPTPQPSFAAVATTTASGNSSAWAEATVRALQSEGAVLVDTVPADIAKFCPAYEGAAKAQRQAFWTGLFSHLARYPIAGDSLVACSDLDTSGLTVEQAGMSCTVRTVARNVVQDGALIGGKKGWLGMARDWLPLRDKAVQSGVANWTASQPYCH